MSHSIPDRSGLSLLEVMIATGILAGSAIVLSSIIGTGARFGNRAESRITAMVQAHSVLDETLARIAAGNAPEEYTGSDTSVV
jgi:Tfp pilus assembly protein PilV